MNIEDVPPRSGIYAIMKTSTGERYVGQAVDMNRRVREHVRELDAGHHFAHIQRRWLQEAWTKHGKGAFQIVVLEEVRDNRSETDYHVRPDNLSLAEQWYIDERSEYNPDKRIVRDQFAHLVRSQAWRDKPSADGVR